MNKQTTAQTERLMAKFDTELIQASRTYSENELTINRLDAQNDQLNARMRHLRNAIDELELLLPPVDDECTDYTRDEHTVYSASAYPVTADYVSTLKRRY